MINNTHAHTHTHTHTQAYSGSGLDSLPAAGTEFCSTLCCGVASADERLEIAGSGGMRGRDKLATI